MGNLDPNKLILNGNKKEKIKVSDQKPIGTLMVLLTEDCSLRCDYCFCGKKSKRNMSKKTAEDTVDWFLSEEVSGKKESLKFTFWGGEPMFNWDLALHIMDYAKEKTKNINKKIKFNMTTNGMHYNKKTIQDIKDYNVGVLTSLDGIKEAHDVSRKLPNGEGSFDTIKEKIKLLTKKFPNKSVRISLSPLNVEYLGESVKYMYEELGFKRVLWSGVEEHPGWNQEKFKVLEEEFEKVTDYYIKKKKEGDSKLAIKFLDEGIENKLFPKVRKRFCGAGSGLLAIGVDGRIYPCHRLNKFEENKKPLEEDEMAIGTIYDGITKPEVREMFLSGNHRVGCKGCKLYKNGFCKGSCYAANYDWNKKDILLAPPMHCFEEKIKHKMTIKAMEELYGVPLFNNMIANMARKKGTLRNPGAILCLTDDINLLEENEVKYYKDKNNIKNDINFLKNALDVEEGKKKDEIVTTFLEKKIKELKS